jgi:hypothetical protein
VALGVRLCTRNLIYFNKDASERASGATPDLRAARASEGLNARHDKSIESQPPKQCGNQSHTAFHIPYSFVGKFESFEFPLSKFVNILNSNIQTSQVRVKFFEQ